ncbi:CpsB/CapC family capsule biosynthesis tyrosine phosphatase [Acetobacterium woodii]|uniref:protein-tyrosine-phosphatase n=1 Tax=Acetobacterium woodii (strain ATCC 29683 / DSM 1030 / JCM 2381 / KCTC 1655 / WB1) TaxID=931626 RepID=H6LEK6_ACEWD|nr:CpsB/CapC family capsule biosynthesis tyrosine phosphatase [Acetobacterium woodii]AFA48109.1 tyrosine-protein phosphatase CpsB [Acetobacterium woodii DSM 1030]
MIDFHSHILPGMDDGSKNIEESLKMIEASFNQGVEMIVATPHFYPWQEKPEDFLARREHAIKSLPGPLSTLRVGAEIAYYDGIDYSEDIELLKIADTELILIEMPMTIWTNRMLDSLYNMENRTKLKVVLAHFERYLKVQKRTDQSGYIGDNFFIQINADYFINRSTQRKALKLFKENRVDFIGSDCHNLTSRPPNLGEAYQTIKNKCGIKSVTAFDDKQNQYFKGGIIYER